MQNRYWTKTKNITIIQEKCERKGKNRQKHEYTKENKVNDRKNAKKKGENIC